MRMMRVFAQNSGQILDQFSKEFEHGFLQILSHSHGGKKVSANRIYQEYIADKQHTHMNATIWTTLTGFCKYLGKEGKCEVEETEKGWFIKYIDRDPQVLLRQAQREERKQSELNEEEINKQIIDAQVKAAFERANQRKEEESDNSEDDYMDGEDGSDYDEDDEGTNEDEQSEGLNVDDKKLDEDIQKKDGEREIVTNTVIKEDKKKKKSRVHQPIKLNAVPAPDSQSVLKKRSVAAVFEEEDEEATEEHANDSAQSGLNEEMVVGNVIHVGRKMGGSIEQLQREEQQRKRLKSTDEGKSSTSREEVESRSRQNEENLETWLQRGLIVKIVDKGSRYYKQKGIIKDVWKRKSGSGYEAEVQLIEERKTYEVCREADVETVVPKVGEVGLLLRGQHRGRKARVLEIRIDKYCCDVELLHDNTKRKGIEYEEICKFDSY